MEAGGRRGTAHVQPSGATLGLNLSAIAAPQRVEAGRRLGVGAAVGVRAEEVAQPLGQCRRQPLGAQRVVVGQRRGEAGDRDAQLGGRHHHAAPAVDTGLDGIAGGDGGAGGRDAAIAERIVDEAVGRRSIQAFLGNMDADSKKDKIAELQKVMLNG